MLDASAPIYHRHRSAEKMPRQIQICFSFFIIGILAWRSFKLSSQTGLLYSLCSELLFAVYADYPMDGISLLLKGVYLMLPIPAARDFVGIFVV